MAFNDNISQLTGNSSFYDWFNKENDEIIAKLNQLSISGATSGDGVRVTLVPATGVATFSIGGTSGNITSGLTFSGAVSFAGNVNVPHTSFKITGITLGTPGYTFGSVVRITSSGYTAAIANTPDSSEVVGVISQRTISDSTVTLLGKIDGDFSGVSGGTLSPGCIYFLSPTIRGNITDTEPTTVGQVSKPVIMGLGQTAGFVLQYRGNYLNSSEVGPGISGSNIMYATFATSPTDPRTVGFSAGMFLSFAPNILNGSTFFHGYINETGRTAISGWFLSGNHNLLLDLHYSDPDVWSNYQDLPNEEDMCVGMVQNISVSGGNLIYEIVTRGFSSVVPKSVSNRGATASGFWIFANPAADTVGSTYNIYTGDDQLSRFDGSGLQGNGGVEESTYESGCVFENNPTRFFVNPRPTTKNFSQSSVAKRASDSANIIQNNLNYAYNGDFSVWSRNTGKFEKYTSNDNTYFADSWIRRIDSLGTITSFIERQNFDFGNTDVEGSPEYYTDIKFLAAPSPAAGPTGAFSVGHVFEGSDAFNESDITVSFYAKCTHTGYSPKVYFIRYVNGAVSTAKQTIGTFNPTLSWVKYTFVFDSHIGNAIAGVDDYVEIGIDFNPLVMTAYGAGTLASTNVFTSIASFVVYKGDYALPTHKFEAFEDKLKKAQKFYLSTYIDTQEIGSKTMVNNDDAVLNVHSFQYLPVQPYSIFKLPNKMRTTPTVTIYSPTGTISQPEVYNATALRDLKNTSGTYGYASASRKATLGNSTVSTTQDETTIKINILGGAVPYDVMNCHIIADASYPI